MHQGCRIFLVFSSASTYYCSNGSGVCSSGGINLQTDSAARQRKRMRHCPRFTGMAGCDVFIALPNVDGWRRVCCEVCDERRQRRCAFNCLRRKRMFQLPPLSPSAFALLLAAGGRVAVMQGPSLLSAGQDLRVMQRDEGRMIISVIGDGLRRNCVPPAYRASPP